jgi:hypothetical protein
MSHIVKIKTNLTNTKAIAMACKRLGLSFGTDVPIGYLGAKEILVCLPNWAEPIEIAPSGEVSYDNDNGLLGDITELDKFRQTYSQCVLEEFLILSGMYVENQVVNASGELVLTVKEV